ncbi:MAG: hypothetical protein ACI8RD_003625 [Bacillariaceae sp.]|jgi:hypothetical protein
MCNIYSFLVLINQIRLKLQKCNLRKRTCGIQKGACDFKVPVAKSCKQSTSTIVDNCSMSFYFLPHTDLFST